MFIHTNDGIELYYEKHGEGRPLLLVHGNGEDHTIFEEAVEILQEHFTCYTVDSRGHGRSTPVTELHYADMARDLVDMMEELQLQDVIFYGFSDGGILGLLAAAECSRIGTLITSGANLTPKGVKVSLRILIRLMYLVKRDPKMKLMMQEPHISDDTLGRIHIPALVLAGSRDLILEKETRHIASALPKGTLKILPGEGHGSYIVHSRKIAKEILAFCT